ncbi:CTLH/CRA C-terminal to lish motif domain-containing protein [Lipomyces japonicus]|uniref:CTLH/CRA C-terminal to lish motif domain-containing protein n=1 Tax=Lipomyces japonicus TaxID=56871 RepID=UPI0034CD330A
MDSIRKEFEGLERNGDFGIYLNDMDDFITKLKIVRNRIANAPQSRNQELENVKGICSSWSDSMSRSQKKLHASIRKYGKALDKKYKIDIEAAYNTNAFPPSSDRLLNRAIAMHLIREGDFQVADNLISDAKLDIPERLEQEFKELYQILGSITKHDLEPAIAWAASKSSKLTQRGSDLEFELHRLQYVHFFTFPDRQGPEQALQYARDHFSSFGDRYLSEISKLMCAFLYQTNLLASPYAATFLSPTAWQDVEQSFTKEFCSLLGLSSQSPLYLAATAGAIALPPLLKVGTIMKEKQTEWSSENELPVEIGLPESLQFHSIFVCPVSKEQTTDDNPPMMMPCGHVVAKESLMRMSKGNISQRFKCPYCPTESTPAQAIRVYF